MRMDRTLVWKELSKHSHARDLLHIMLTELKSSNFEKNMELAKREAAVLGSLADVAAAQGNEEEAEMLFREIESVEQKLLCSDVQNNFLVPDLG